MRCINALQVKGLSGNMTTRVVPIIAPLLSRICTGEVNMGKKYEGGQKGHKGKTC